MKPGDVVMLKTGGPKMTIEGTLRDGFTCVWFEGNGVGGWTGPFRSAFIADALETVKGANA